MKPLLCRARTPIHAPKSTRNVLERLFSVSSHALAVSALCTVTISSGSFFVSARNSPRKENPLRPVTSVSARKLNLNYSIL